MTLLLLLTASHARLQCRNGQKLLLDQVVELSRCEELSGLLARYSAPCRVLVDYAEEDFLPLTLPNVPRRDLKLLVQRQLQARYPKSAFCQSHLQAKQAGETAQTVLLSALTQPTLLTPWLDWLAASGVPLVGVYSLAMLSASWLPHSSATALLVSFQQHAGLRQSYFKAGRLQFSRLTPLCEPAQWSEEVQRTVQFLRRTQPLEGGVTVYWLSNTSEALPTWSQPDVQCVPLAFSPTDPALPQDASLAFLQHLADTRALPHYAPAPYRQQWQRWRMRQFARWGVILGVFLALSWASNNFWQARQTRTAEFQQATRLLQQQTQAVLHTLPRGEASPQQVKAVVQRLQVQGLPHGEPLAVLQPLSRTLDDFPQIELDELSWQGAASGVSVHVQAHFVAASGVRPMAEILASWQASLVRQGYQVSVLTEPWQGGESAQGAFVVQLQRRP